ncbi:MAG TPA: nucleoside monophosphate kinase [Terriglobales bacterium]|nr:nucleoside monophosphate kinase [Terriglobales bacterium]
MDFRLQPSWLLVGPIGAGKTPLGRLMAEKGLAGRRCVHFDFGAELRAVGAAGCGAGLSADEVEVVRRSLATGALLEDSEFPIALEVLRAFVRRTGLSEGDRLVLNGLPRHVGQARMMEDVVRAETVVSLEATAEVLRERIALDTGGDRAGRVDDDVHALRRKLVIFRMRTLPLIEYYDNREVPVLRLTVGARTTAEELYDAVLGFAGRGKPL